MKNALKPVQGSLTARTANIFNNRFTGTKLAAPQSERQQALPQHDSDFVIPNAKKAFRKSFVGLFLFTLLFYARPNDLIPAIGDFPVSKIVIVATLLVFFSEKSRVKAKLFIGSEARKILGIALIGFILMPISASFNDSYTVLFDLYIKVVIIFILLNNVVITRERLYSIMKLVVIAGTVIGSMAIKSYFKGELSVKANRIEGIVGGIFGNPNDLATAMGMLLPLAVALALTRQIRMRWLYLGCAGVLGFAIFITFSRGGFLGLIGLIAVMIWKFGRKKRITAVTIVLVFAGFISALPSDYGDRLSTITDISKDSTGSSQQRWELMLRGIDVATNHLVIGVGMGNMHIYSLDELVAHNAYIEISGELGLAGLLLYLSLIFGALKSLRRIERDGIEAPPGPEREMYYLSICLQGTLTAYIICSFFASIEYQWFLYYPVAYIVSMRRIIQAEERQGEAVASEDGNATALVVRPGEGKLWRSARFQKGLWSTAAK